MTQKSHKIVRTFLHKLGSLYALFDLGFVCDIRLAGKSPVQPVSEICVSKGIISTQEEEFCSSITKLARLLLPTDHSLC